MLISFAVGLLIGSMLFGTLWREQVAKNKKLKKLLSTPIGVIVERSLK